MKVTVENKKGLNKDLKVFVDKKTMNTYIFQGLYYTARPRDTLP